MTTVPKPLFVAIVDDFPITVLGVTALLRPFGRRVRVAAHTGRLPQPGRADVVLYDPFVPPNTLGRIREITRETGAVVLVCSSGMTEAQVVDAMMAGAAAVLPKSVDGPTMMAALEGVATGERVPSAPSPEPESPTGSRWLSESGGLSSQEAAVVSLLVAGLNNQDIAAALHMSSNAVRAHLQAAYRKMGVTGRTDAILWGVKHGFQLHAPAAPLLNDGSQR